MMMSGSIPPKTKNVFQRITVYFDGIISRTPPHPTAWGYLIKIDDTPVAHALGNLPDGTSDITARYTALLEALKALTEIDRMDEPVYCVTDSIIVINAIDRTWGPPNIPDQRKLWNECLKMAAPFSNLKYIWISKSENRIIRDLILPFLITGPSKAANSN